MTDGKTERRIAGTSLALRGYVLGLAGLCLVALPGSFGALPGRWIELLVWTACLMAANLLTIPVLPKYDIDAGIGASVSVAASVVLPPPLALIVNFAGFTNEREFRGGTSAWAILFNRSQIALSAYAAAIVAQGLPFGPVWTTLAAVLVHNAVNTIAVTFWLNLRGRLGFGRAARDIAAPFPRFVVDYGLVALLALAIVLGYEVIGVWAPLLLAAPGYLGYSALRSARVAEDRAEELAAQVEELENLNRLGTALLSSRRADEVATTGAAALGELLETGPVEFSLSGMVSAELLVVKVPGAEPAAIGVPPEVPGPTLAVIEAAAGLLGMALQRVVLETEVAEGQRARVALSGRILEEGTRERSRIALAIHDEVLPFLAAAEIQADNVRSALGGGDPQRADRLAGATREAVNGGIRHLRDVLEALRRQIVVPGGLLPALRESLEELRVNARVGNDLRAPDPMPQLPLAVEIMALELVRGCLTNIARHARAEHVTVELRVVGEALQVEVTDDGCGFDPATVPPGHHGLALMAQRTELARGTFTVESAPGTGTSVRVEVPL